MEYWSFPPAYDDRYFPAESSRYWFPVRETMPAGDRDSAILQRLIARTQRVRRERDAATFDRLIGQLLDVAEDESQNIMPITIELVRAGATNPSFNRLHQESRPARGSFARSRNSCTRRSDLAGKRPATVGDWPTVVK